MTQAPVLAAEPMSHANDVVEGDPYVWLEDWTGPRAMGWVESENARTLGLLQGDPHFKGFYDDAYAIASAKDRIPNPELLNGRIFNFWREADHPQGIWRAISEAEFAKPAPVWKTVLDLDALSKAEGKKWVWKGSTCLGPDEKRCLISLSDGGEDAVTVREFDLVSGTFVVGGFTLPTSKQDVAWLDRDTLLVARDWGAGTLTTSGYPFVIKQVKRGQNVDAAKEIYRGEASDVGASPFTLEDAKGNRAAFVQRSRTFFESTKLLLGANGATPLPFPDKSEIKGMIDGMVIIQTSQIWHAGSVTVPSGAIAAVPLKALQAGGGLTPQILFAPNARQSVEGVAATKSRVIVKINDNVRGRALSFAPTARGWKSIPITLPDNSAVDLVSTSDKSDTAYLRVQSFLLPTTLWAADAVGAKAKQVKALSAKFDASRHIVEQFEAVSTDGTKIPYFIVHRKDIALDGNTPTLMTAYGGFEVSETPYYPAIQGKLWLERGGSFVLANIRGGGEFGPAWHEAGRKTKRQIIYDDFAAVAKDIFARKLSSPRRFGIFGGSNGGLLMGVEFNQHPELWNAVAIEVPLLDMLRMEKIAAGASWVDEYGSLSVPEEKAFLAKISPYANIRKGVAYPEPYIWTTTKDDRVGPQHARKFVARLKEYGIPYLFYEDTAGGHSGDADIAQNAKLRALEMVYFTRKLMDPPAR